MSENWDFPNPATPQGSAYYYVARFSEPPQRNRVAQWLAWFAHLDEMFDKAKDPGATRLKLDWWQEEAQHTLENRARHPLAEALAPQVTERWQVDQMCRALQAIEQRILRRRPADGAAYREQCLDSHGSRVRLLVDSDRPESQQAADRIALYLATIEHLRHLGHDAHRDQLCLPTGLLNKHEVNAESLRSGQPVPGLPAMARELLEFCRIDNLAQLRRQRELLPALRLLAQARRLERQLQRYDFASHQRHFQVTPLGLLWSAWRMR